MFGVGRQRVYQLMSRPDFPAPVARLKAGAVWRKADVVEWARARGREIQDES
jgi:prophage regulatory protein